MTYIEFNDMLLFEMMHIESDDDLLWELFSPEIKKKKEDF